jgi:hypothetical protein
MHVNAGNGRKGIRIFFIYGSIENVLSCVNNILPQDAGYSTDDCFLGRVAPSVLMPVAS